MGLQLRVSIPDRPGALGQTALAMAKAGADVIGVTVLESESGRAIDDFRLRWPDGKDVDGLIAAVSSGMGVEVLGCRRTRWLMDGRPDLDLLTYVLAVPDHGVETLVDMAPAALDADWAELRPPGRRLPALYSSSTTTHDDIAPSTMPVRATAWQGEGMTWAYFPIALLRSVLVVGRDGGPPFLRAEIVQGERILDLATSTLARVLNTDPAKSLDSELTSCLTTRLPA
jgi:hypothetical protein